MKVKTVLVTGGAGFIGSHLCHKLILKKYKVICLDDLSTGSKQNISNLFNHKNFEFVKHDINKPYFRQGIDEIYNLACPASPIQYQKNPIKTIKTCTIGVINILGLAKANKAKVLQASTSEVYGDPLEHPQKENYFGNVNTTGPRSCYDEGKRCSEALFMDYHREHKLKIKIARIFNTYGPNMSKVDGRVISNFITNSLLNENLLINGDGSQTRSFMYIDDLIFGLIELMSSSSDLIGPINFGNTHEITIIELSDLILKLTNSKSQVKFKKLEKDDPKRRKPDISFANENLNWQPNYDLHLGLNKTISYFKEIL